MKKIRRRRPIAKKVPVGQRTIKVTLAFWTDDTADGKGMIRPKHAWETGTVYMTVNRAHGITTTHNPTPFGDRHGLKELPTVVQKVLRKHGVVLHRERR